MLIRDVAKVGPITRLDIQNIALHAVGSLIFPMFGALYSLNVRRRRETGALAGKILELSTRLSSTSLEDQTGVGSHSLKWKKGREA